MTTMRNTLAALACAALALGCEGENLFTGPGSGIDADRPELTRVAVPTSVTPNDLLRIEVDARSEEGLTALDIVLEGGMTRDTTIAFDPPDLDLQTVAVFDVPNTVTPGSVIRVAVTATDRLGASSETAEADVQVLEDDGAGP